MYTIKSNKTMSVYKNCIITSKIELLFMLDMYTSMYFNDTLGINIKTIEHKTTYYNYIL